MVGRHFVRIGCNLALPHTTRAKVKMQQLTSYPSQEVASVSKHYDV